MRPMRIGFDAGDTPRLTALQKRAVPIRPRPARNLVGSHRHLHRPATSRCDTQRIDRLSIAYTGAHLVVRAGRQALTWGAGLVFRPMDLFDPFAPDATDTEYKPGTDMLYGQYLFDDGSDLQAVIVPRPAASRRRADRRCQFLCAALSTPRSATADDMACCARSWRHGRRRRRQRLAGRGDLECGNRCRPSCSGGGTDVSALANISNAGTLWGRDVTYFAEYYRNGFGLDATALRAGQSAAGADRPAVARTGVQHRARLSGRWARNCNGRRCCRSRRR